MKKNKPTFNLWEVILIAFVTSIIMSITTGYALFTSGRIKNCSTLTNNEHLGEFITTYNSIVTEYYKEVSEEGLVNAAINGMMDYLDDPYTTYLNENSKNALLESLKGKYQGIGIEILKQEEGPIQIVTVFEDSPAAVAGLKNGDIIKSINDVDLTDKSSEDAVDIIKKSEDKNIKITVSRNEELISFVVERKTLYIPVIEDEIFEVNNQKVGYIRISKFSETVGQQFGEHLKKLEEQGMNNLIIDLRNNTGGYLKGSTDIASIFIKEGEIIYSLQTNLDKKDYKDETKESKDYKVVILINKNSASASEVLAAALKYSYGAKLVGVTSYGKGTVQQTSEVSDKTMIKYTTAKWLTPMGNCIDGIGLTPDTTVELSIEENATYSYEIDNQLQTAIQEITK